MSCVKDLEASRGSPADLKGEARVLVGVGTWGGDTDCAMPPLPGSFGVERLPADLARRMASRFALTGDEPEERGWDPRLC